MKIVKKIILVILIIISHIGLTYSGYGTALIGSLLIILFSYLYCPKTWKANLGLKINFVSFLISVGLLFFTLFSAYFIIKSISNSEGIFFSGKLNSCFYYMHTMGQTLNEEMILGGLLLLSLKRIFKNKYSLTMAISIALVFAILHLFFYKYIVIGLNRGNLSFLTISNLFLVGLIRNILILYFDHILYAWAIHLGWNTIFFTNLSILKFSEPVLFNTFLGTLHMLFFLITVLLVIVIIVYFSNIARYNSDSSESKRI